MSQARTATGALFCGPALPLKTSQWTSAVLAAVVAAPAMKTSGLPSPVKSPSALVSGALSTTPVGPGDDRAKMPFLCPRTYVTAKDVPVASGPDKMTMSL